MEKKKRLVIFAAEKTMYVAFISRPPFLCLNLLTYFRSDSANVLQNSKVANKYFIIMK